MNICYVDKIQNVIAFSTRISANSVIKGRSASKITYWSTISK